MGATVFVVLWGRGDEGQGKPGMHVPSNPPQPAQNQPAAWTTADLKIHKGDFAHRYFRMCENHLLSELAVRMEVEGLAQKHDKTDSVVLVVEFIPLEAARRAGKLKVAARHGDRCRVSGFVVIRDDDGTVASPIAVAGGENVGTVQTPECAPKAAAVFLLRIAAPEEWFRPLTTRMTPDEARKAIERELEFSIPDA